MVVNIAKLVFYEKHLEHVAVAIAKESMVVACSTEYNDFFHILWHHFLDKRLKAFATYHFRTQPMPLCSPECIPLKFTQFFESVQKINKKTRIVLGLNITNRLQGRKAEHDFCLLRSCRLYFIILRLNLLCHQPIVS